MASLNLTFEVDNVAVLETAFTRLAREVENLEPAFQAAQKIFREAETDNFQSDNAKGQLGRWAPLSDAYQKQKNRKLGFLGSISLERLTDRLYKSLTGETEDTVSVIGKTEATFGTTVPYALAQHYGYARRNLPARPLIDLSEAQLGRMRGAMRKVITDQVNNQTGFVMTDENFADFG